MFKFIGKQAAGAAAAAAGRAAIDRAFGGRSASTNRVMLNTPVYHPTTFWGPEQWTVATVEVISTSDTEGKKPHAGITVPGNLSVTYNPGTDAWYSMTPTHFQKQQREGTLPRPRKAGSRAKSQTAGPPISGEHAKALGGSQDDMRPYSQPLGEFYTVYAGGVYQVNDGNLAAAIRRGWGGSYKWNVYRMNPEGKQAETLGWGKEKDFYPAKAQVETMLRMHVDEDKRRGRKNAPSTKQRKKMGSKLQSLPWSLASQTYKRKHPQYKGIGGYPMDTLKRARAARSLAVLQLNKGNLTQADVKTIFGRTGRKYSSLPKFTALVCKGSAKKRKCRSVTKG